jgi:hypothetical protein
MAYSDDCLTRRPRTAKDNASSSTGRRHAPAAGLLRTSRLFALQLNSDFHSIKIKYNIYTATNASRK